MAEPTWAWEHTAYKSGGTSGPAHVRVEPDRLLVELDLYRLVRKITRRPARPIEIRVRDVVSIGLVQSWSGSVRCLIVAGHGLERREHWLSSWVGEQWARLASGLPPLTRP